MENRITLQLREQYKATAHSRHFIIGVPRDGIVYATFHDMDVIDWAFMGADIGCHGKKEYAVKLRLNDKIAANLFNKAKRIIPVCKLATMESMRRPGFTRGEILEYFLLKEQGIKWDKATMSESHKTGDDIVIDGIGYEVKSWDSTLCRERNFR